MNTVRSGLKGLRANGTLEVPTSFTGRVLVVNSVCEGEIEITSGELRFKWSSSTVAFPAAFNIEKPAGYTVPTINHTDKYEHQAFTGSTSSHDVSGCHYEIKVDGDTVGWMKLNSTNTEWYAAPGYLVSGYFDGDTLEFVANSASGSETAYKVTDDAL